MDGPHRSGPTPTDPDAGTSTWRPSAGYLAVALAIVAGALAYGLMPSPVPPPGPAAAGSAAQAPLPIASTRPVMVAPQPAAASSPAVAAPVRAAVGSVPASAPRIARLRDPDGDLTPDLSDYVNEGEKPTMGEVIDRLHQAGVYGGLGAFSPPGTRPPLVGLAVPEDFNLPEGYVRHHQATDDGQRIEPILMFSPDLAFIDAQQRVPVPLDRIVPPELAPPGLPIRRIAIPAPVAEPGRPGR